MNKAIVPDKHTGGQTMPEQMHMTMPTTVSASRVKREDALDEARKGYARAIEADKPDHILNYWRQKVGAIEYLLGRDE